MKQRGFTLVELMIVIAIIALLATVAIPVYLDYIVRARVVEGLNMASAAKVDISERAANDKQLPANQSDTGYVTPSSTPNVVSITIANDGSAEITITYTARAGDGTIILMPTLQPTYEITWTCTGGTLENRYRPAMCRL